MFCIYAHYIKGQRVQLAPYGIEGDPMPCLVWRDPNPAALIRHCRVMATDGKVLTAGSDSDLHSLAIQTGLLADQDDWYIP